jgi:hypothetical protein
LQYDSLAAFASGCAQSEMKGPVDRAVGKEVRVVGTDGSKRTGRLQTLSPTEVVFDRQGERIAVPLERVRSVERPRAGLGVAVRS